MKTTLDLPESLLKEVKLRALHEGRKLKDEVAELLRAGLVAVSRPQPARKRLTSARVRTDPKTGLPVIVCDPSAPISKMTAEEILAVEQEAQTKEDLERLGLPF